MTADLVTMFHDTPIDRVISEGGTVIIETDEFAASESETVPPQRITVSFYNLIIMNGTLVDAVADLRDWEIYSLSKLEDRIALWVISPFCSAPLISHLYEFIAGVLHSEHN